MNTRVGAKRILFYGDSLVYGKASGPNERIAANVRFSGVAQDTLGADYEILEEGLRARNLYDENTFFPQRNGLEQFGPIIGSHLGFDLLVLSLGTNNCNATGVVSQEKVDDALTEYRRILTEWCTFLNLAEPKLLVLIPPNINTEFYDEALTRIFGAKAPEKLADLQKYMVAYCQENNLEYLEAASVCEPARGDGVHLDEQNNLKLGQALAGKIKDILG